LTAGRQAKLPFLLEFDDAGPQMIGAIEKRKKSYAFPWQLPRSCARDVDAEFPVRLDFETEFVRE